MYYKHCFVCSITFSTLSRLIDLSFNVIIFSELFISDDHRRTCIPMCIFLLYHGMCVCIKCMCICAYVWQNEKKSVWVFCGLAWTLSLFIYNLWLTIKLFVAVCLSAEFSKIFELLLWNLSPFCLLSFSGLTIFFISLSCSSIRSAGSCSRWFSLITFSSRIMLFTLHLTKSIRTSADRKTLRLQSSAKKQSLK